MVQVFEDDNRLVVIRSHLNAAEGRLMRTLLDARGIHAFLAGENVAGMNEGLFANLMVRAGDRQFAEEILSNVTALPAQVRHDPDGEELACKRCGSQRVHPYVGPLRHQCPSCAQTPRPKMPATIALSVAAIIAKSGHGFRACHSRSRGVAYWRLPPLARFG